MGLNVTGTLDLIYRKQKYQDYLSRLEALKQVGTPPTQLPRKEYSDINDRLSVLLKSIKQLTDKAVVKQAYYLLGIPVTLLVLYHIYLTGVGLAVVFLTLLLAFFIAAHYVMKSLVDQNKTLTLTTDIVSGDMPTYLISKLSYINSGLDIKKYRVILLGLFFILFFPALLYYGFNLLDHSMTSSTIWLISFIFSVGYWTYYFKNRLDPISDIEEELSTIDYELNQLLTS